MLSYDNVVSAAKIGCDFDKLQEDDEIIAYLPVAWVGDHIFSYAGDLAGLYVNCPENADTIVEDRREIGAAAFALPRVFENMLTLRWCMEDASAPSSFFVLHRSAPTRSASAFSTASRA